MTFAIRLPSGLHLALVAVLTWFGQGLAATADAVGTPFGGRYVFKTYAEDDGLLNLSPVALLQDRSGFIWVGTQDGLYRFEGRTFTRFGVDDGLPSSRIYCLHETADGRIFVGTRTGLARWDGGRFAALGAKAGLPETTVYSIASDSTLLFVGTARGLYLSLAELFHVDARKDGPETAVTGLHVDPRGVLFLGRGGTLYRREGSLAVEFGSTKALPPLDRIDATLTDAEGRLYVRTPTRLLMLDRGGLGFVSVDDALPPAVGVGSLSLDPTGALLIPTRSGLARRDATGTKLLGRTQGLESETVLSALVDREGSFWMGLAGVGLLRRLGNGSFTAWDEAAGLAHDVVWSIVRGKTRHRALWVGTQDGLSRIDEDGTIHTIRERDGLAGNVVVALAAAEDGGVWAGSFPGGVTRVPLTGSPQRFEAEGLPPADFQVLALHVRKNGEVWAGTSAGAFRLRGDRFERVTAAGAEPQDSIYGFAEDGKILYGAGRLGLTRLTGPNPRRFGRRSGLKADFISSLLGLPDGTLLLGYAEAGGQRVRVQGEQLLISSFGDAARLEKLVFLGRDSTGGIWAGGAGVAFYADDTAARPVRFDKDDGLISRDMTQNAFFGDHDGVVWFGTSRGLVRFQPGIAAAPEVPVPVALTGCATATKKLRTDKPATLPAGERSLRLSWAGLSARAASRLRYRYTVNGFTEKAVETPRTDLELAGLRAGTFRFEVVALTPSGRVSPAPAAFTFTVPPSFSETWWFRLGLVALLLAAVGAVVKARTRLLVKERDEVHDQLTARDLEIGTLKRQLDEAATTDPLTQTRNRRFFFEMVRSDVDRAIRAFSSHGTPVERRNGDVVSYLVHVDELGAVNSRHGHAAGDATLVEISRRLKGVVRGSDFLVRWSGEDFLVVTRSSSREQGQVLAQRILSVVGETPVDLPGGGILQATCSIGWAPFPLLTEAPSEITYEEVLRLTARALDDALAKGGNRACGAQAASAEASIASRLREAVKGPLRGVAELRILDTEGPKQI